jgi:hypothetical protein
LLDFIAESIAIDALRVQALSLGELVKSGGVIPAGGARFLFRTLFFKEDAQRVGTRAKGGGNT